MTSRPLITPRRSTSAVACLAQAAVIQRDHDHVSNRLPGRTLLRSDRSHCQASGMAPVKFRLLSSLRTSPFRQAVELSRRTSGWWWLCRRPCCRFAQSFSQTLNDFGCSRSDRSLRLLHRSPWSRAALHLLGVYTINPTTGAYIRSPPVTLASTSQITYTANFTVITSKEEDVIPSGGTIQVPNSTLSRVTAESSSSTR